MVKNQPPKKGLRTDCAFLGGQNRGLLVFLDKAKRAPKRVINGQNYGGLLWLKSPFP